MTTLSRFSPLMLLLFLIVAAMQLAMQLGVTRAVLNEALSRWSWLYAAVAGLGLATVVAGFLYEWLGVGIPASRKGRIINALNRLTNRAVPEAATMHTPQVAHAADLAARLKAKVIGQDSVCDDMAAQIRRRLAFERRDKPVGVFLLAGSPGTGKSYLAKRLATELGRKLLALDMTQFASPHAASQMFGAPKGYIGSDSYGVLTAGLRAAPDAVVLLDEFDKAHPEVHKRFLTAWNDGYITEVSDGRHISTAQAIFMLTSNAATDALASIVARHAGDPVEVRRLSVQALRAAGFAPEMLNRLDRVFVFRPLASSELLRIAELEIEAVIQNYGLKVAEGGIDPALLIAIVQRQQRMGAAASARDLARAIEEAIADSLVAAKQQKAGTVALRFDRGAVSAIVAN